MYFLNLGVKGLMRFRIQNAPYPTLHECFFFSRSVAWIGKNVIILLEDNLLPISANLAIFCRGVTRIVRGRLGQVLWTKNRIMKNCV